MMVILKSTKKEGVTMKRAMMLCLILLFGWMVGCSKDEQSVDSFEQELQESVNQKETESPPLKILTYLDQKYFDQFYGTAVKKKYPNIQIELIPLKWEESITESVEQNNPDIIISWVDNHRELAQAGMLAEIDYSLFDIENFHPKVISYLEAVGDGKLYGLTNAFFVEGLIYNKKFFDRYHFEYPTDGMTWDDLFQIAKKFPKEEGEEPSYGFYERYNISFTIANIQRTSGLSYFDKVGRVNLHTEEWKYLLSLLEDGLLKRYFYASYSTDEKDLFKMNRAAMTLKSITLDELNEEEHGFVTVPSGLRRQTNQMLAMSPNYIMSVTTKTKHPDAWEIMKYMNSEELARQNLDQMFGLPARLNLIPENHRKKIAPFLQLEADLSWLNADSNQLTELQDRAIYKVTSGFIQQFMAVGDSAKRITSEDIRNIEEQAQSELGVN